MYWPTIFFGQLLIQHTGKMGRRVGTRGFVFGQMEECEANRILKRSENCDPGLDARRWTCPAAVTILSRLFQHVGIYIYIYLYNTQAVFKHVGMFFFRLSVIAAESCAVCQRVRIHDDYRMIWDKTVWAIDNCWFTFLKPSVWEGHVLMNGKYTNGGIVYMVA